MAKTRTSRPSRANAAGQADAATPEIRWTVMVFMGVDTVDGDHPMHDAAVADLMEMAAVGSGDGLQIHVQVHADKKVRRGKLTTDMVDALKAKRLDAIREVPAAAPHPRRDGELETFITETLKAVDDPADPQHYSMLVLWGHAYDFAIGHSPGAFGDVEVLDFVELGHVLGDIQARVARTYGMPSPPKFDIVAFDACDVATVELACELAPFAAYLLASQIGVPIPGWPYDKVLSRLRAPFGRTPRPTELGAWIVNRYCERYAELGEVSLSMLDLTRAPDLVATAAVLADFLFDAVEADPGRRAVLADLFERSLTEEDKPFVDAADLCLSLARAFDDEFVKAAATALGNFLIAPVPGTREASHSAGEGLPFVVANGRVGCETARLNGVGMYAPHVAPDHDFAAVRRLYEKFAFAKGTRWSAIVHALAAMELAGTAKESER